MKMKSLTSALALSLFLLSCGGKADKKEEISKTETSSGANATTTSTASVTDDKDGKVSFKINDTLVRTNKTAGGDTDAHIGLYTEASGYFSLSLMGDVPNRPHRGWISFSLKDFKFEPGSYSISKDNFVNFSRYETINAGGEVGYSANGSAVFKGTEMNLTISKIVPDPESFNGRDWLASGTFAAKMLIKEHNPYKRTSNEGVNISEGTFENVRIAGGPKAKQF